MDERLKFVARLLEGEKMAAPRRKLTFPTIVVPIVGRQPKHN